jgi:cell wall-associated NlpC family hydrolase
MTDRRLHLANDRVAHSSLEGSVDAVQFSTGTEMMIQQPMANIVDKPRGQRVSQLLFGERFLVIETHEGFAFGRSERDGQVGYIVAGALVEPQEPTHWVAAPATHLYPKANLKAPPEVAIFFGSRVRVVAERDSYLKVHSGHFIPKPHLQPLRARFGDPAGVADLFLGSPYLWGGCSRWGMDCSGLIQIALIATGMECPRDSDQQQDALGRDLHLGEPFIRGDLVFWKGHVGIMANERMLLHANAHHMAVAYEPLRDAAARIAESEGGSITARKRLVN